MRSLDTQLVCARQMTMKCAYLSVAYCGHTVRHCTRASRGQVDVKPRKQIIAGFQCHAIQNRSNKK